MWTPWNTKRSGSSLKLRMPLQRRMAGPSSATSFWIHGKNLSGLSGLSVLSENDCMSSLKTDKPLSPDKFFPWIQKLVAEDGPAILRCKGILNFKDDPDRFVFQGVHMILDGDHQRPWK